MNIRFNFTIIMMHPRITELYNKMREIPFEKIQDIEVLYFLKECGATSTEAAIVLHQGFELDLDEVDEFVINSNVFNSQNINDVFYETLKYLYYNPDDPNYRADDNSVSISF